MSQLWRWYESFQQITEAITCDVLVCNRHKWVKYVTLSVARCRSSSKFVTLKKKEWNSKPHFRFPENRENLMHFLTSYQYANTHNIITEWKATHFVRLYPESLDQWILFSHLKSNLSPDWNLATPSEWIAIYVFYLCFYLWCPDVLMLSVNWANSSCY